MLLVLGAAAAGVGACTGDGRPTTPQKIADYTRDNVKRSVRDAPAEPRRVGKRITHAVGSTPSKDDEAPDKGEDKAEREGQGKPAEAQDTAK